jgi:hypothetical protein
MTFNFHDATRRPRRTVQRGRGIHKDMPVDRARYAIPMAVSALTVAAGMFVSSPVRAEGDKAEVYGTIVSVRANILEIRPMLRPKNVRVAIEDKTIALEDKSCTVSDVKEGMRVLCGGPYSKDTGPHPEWVELADKPIGYLADTFDGIMMRAGGSRARVGGIIKSLKPFVITDDKGKDFTIPTDKVEGYWRLAPIDKSALLIGVRVNASGIKAADGVIKAETIYPERNFAQFGAMFGEIMAVHGNVIEVRPRYQTDSIEVTRLEPCTIQREVHLNPDSVKVGDTVTFWGTQHHAAWELHKSDDLTAIELIIGKGRYPHSATDGDNPPVFLTGKLASIEPAVQIKLASGKYITVTVPAQMPVVRLEAAGAQDLKPGSQAMLVLSRNASGAFETKAIMLDASPWVGYGQ